MIKNFSLIYKNLNYILITKKKYTLTYIILMISCILLKYIIKAIPNEDLFLSVLGLKFKFEADVFTILFHTLYFIYFMYLAITLLINDLQYGKDNIFLRISYQKWLKQVLISLLISDFIIRILSYLIIFFIYFILNCKLFSFNKLLIIFIFDLIYIILIQYISLLIYNYKLLKNKILFILNCGLILLLIILPLFSIKYLLIIIFSIIIFLLIQLFKLRTYSYTKILRESEE